VLPGNASIVHDALIYTTGPTRGTPNVIAAWVPGLAPVATGPGAGFLWRAGEQLAVRIHYKKTWKYENKPASDRTTVGVYLLKGAGRDVRSLPIPLLRLPGAVVDEDIQALAVRSAEAPSDVTVRIEAVKPDGSRLPIGGFSTRSGWDQRYWLERPAAVPKGTRFDVITTGALPGSLRLWIEYLVPST
jgi:hypothetical protein